jgi:hypothetical protein
VYNPMSQLDVAAIHDVAVCRVPWVCRVLCHAVLRSAYRVPCRVPWYVVVVACSAGGMCHAPCRMAG